MPVAYVTDGQRVLEDLHGGPGLCDWLVRAAVTLARSRRRSVDEEFMANQFGEVITHAHA